MEKLGLIKIVKECIVPSKIKLSDKYGNVFSKEDAKNFDEHTQTCVRNR